MKNPKNLPPYLRIAEALIERIKRGEFQPGDRLPAVRQIVEAEGVSSGTASRVPPYLVSKGWAIATPGVGTIVADRRLMTSGRTRLLRLDGMGQPYALKESSTEHRAAVRSVADPGIAELLGVELRDEAVIRYRVFRDDNKPVVVAASFIHIRALADVPELLTQGQLKPFWQTTYTERTGRPITRGIQQFGARLANDDDRLALDIDDDAPAALLVERNVFHDEGGPIEVWDDANAPGFWGVEAK